MASQILSNGMISGEVAFCKVYSADAKSQLEKLFLKNRISYFIEWQDRSFFSRLLKKEDGNEKNVFIIRIHEADLEKATKLVEGMDSVKIRKKKEN